jgi:sialidase-1
MKKLTAIFMSLLLILSLIPVYASASAGSSSSATPIFRVENKQMNNNNFVDLSEYLDELKTLEEGTIIARFIPSGTGIMSLFSLGNSTQANIHYNLYVSAGTVGFENRTTNNLHVKKDTNIATNEVHTVAVVTDPTAGHKIYLNGKLIVEDTTSDKRFLSAIPQSNNAKVGHTARAAGYNQYPFSGKIDFVEVYGETLSHSELLSITGATSKDVRYTPLPEDALITEPIDVFYPGLFGSNNYRIPALLYTQEGTLIAGIDKRVQHGGDSPANIDMIVRRSLDEGDTWGDEVMINNYPGAASNIDQTLLQDSRNGRIFSLVDGWPEGYGFPNANPSSGFVEVNGTKYMKLKDSSNNIYTIRENGVVYNSNNVATTYTVDQKRYLYQNGTQVSHIFLSNSPLKADPTSFLELWYSDDQGETWTGPIELNGNLKEDWMAFLGTGPGNGIQLQEGPKAGRLILPVYFTNQNRSQASALIYSDDGGETWQRGQSPNHGRVVNGQTLNERTFTGNEITESQVVELPGGQLKLFMRNYSGYAQIATSHDGGETWEDTIVTETAVPAPYAQMSAIRYNGTIDGKPAIIFSSASSSSSRVNGVVRAGLIHEDGLDSQNRQKYRIEWKYSKLVKEGHYAYSSLTNLADGRIGLLYEGTGDREMSYIKFNPEYLMADQERIIDLIELSSVEFIAPEDGYASGATVQAKLNFNQFMMLNGNRQLVGTIDNQTFNLSLVDQTVDGTEFTFEGQLPTLADGSYTLTAALASNVSLVNGFGNAFTQTGNIGSTTIQIGEPVVEALMTLSGPVSSKVDETFELSIALANSTTTSFAEEIKLSYSNLTYLNTRALNSGVSIVEVDDRTEGALHILLANLEGGITGNVPLISLGFQAPSTEGTGQISINKAIIADQYGNEIELAGRTWSIEVESDLIANPDVNGDGKISVGDLAMIAANYGKKFGDADWNQVKHLDIDGDKEIGLNDLVAIAIQML